MSNKSEDFFLVQLLLKFNGGFFSRNFSPKCLFNLTEDLFRKMFTHSAPSPRLQRPSRLAPPVPTSYTSGGPLLEPHARQRRHCMRIYKHIRLCTRITSIMNNYC